MSEPSPDALLAPDPSELPTAPERDAPPDYQLGQAVPFLLCHLIPLGALWSGVTTESVICCFALVVARTWGITAGYHRYFAHRTYKTSRWFQFVLAFWAQTSVQKGALWWAAHHRVHHKLSDKVGDVHSPARRGFFYAHVGWLFNHTGETRWDKIQDFQKYPELVWLNRHFLVPPLALGFVVWLALGWAGLFIGFFLSTVLLWHNTFMINSVMHVWGTPRFPSDDTSRNNAITALMTLGEGWHNNHHYYQSCTRNGFYWWEIDITYYVLKILSWVGLVWDLREPPERVLALGRQLDAERRAARVR